MSHRQVTLLFLWHMHQPFYKDTHNGTYVMPWVRLHATKGYYDLPQVLERWGVKGCINVVPSLIEQIEDHVHNAVADRWRTLTFKRPEEMDEEEKAFVLRNFFMLCWDRLVHSSPRYLEILTKRERFVGKISWTEMTRFFSPDEILDLQVLFNLKWFGFMARERYPFLKRLDEKDRYFTHEEKLEMMRIQQKIIGEIIPLYRRLAQEGIIELSFTPFYHPILPLIYDSDSARRSTPSASLPSRFARPEDARWHLSEGKRYSEAVWGRPIFGMWPAEGAVSPEIIPLAASCGVRWLATDEGILFRSVHNADKRQVLYRPWRPGVDEGSPVVFFRDKFLSDLIGFSFARSETDRAVESFLNHLHGIRHAVPADVPAPAVTIALDGENAWENYPENGGPFLNALCKAIAESPEFVSDTFSGYLEKCPAQEHPVLPTLHSGSWIQSDFSIWIGSEEDNTAWEHLRRVRDFLDDYLARYPDTPPEVKEEAFRAIYRAEGSDWFWWYGPQFQTENDYLFDRLFRRHLRRVYTVLGQPYPTVLDLPIKQSASIEALTPPAVLVTPRITGYSDSFYDWAGAGVFDNTRRPGGAMYRSTRVVRRILYCFDIENLYFRVDLIDPLALHEYKHGMIHFYLVDEQDIAFRVPFRRFARTPFSAILTTEGGTTTEVVNAGEAAFGEMLDIRLSIKSIGIRRREKVSCHLKVILPDGTELERVPEVGSFTFTVPDQRTALSYWDI